MMSTDAQEAIRVAMCGTMACSGMGKVVIASIEDGARDQGIDLAPIEVFNSSFDAVEFFTKPAQDEIVDLIVVCDDLGGLSCIQLVREIRAFDREVEIVMAADTNEDALEAIQLNVGAYLVKTPNCEGMDAIIRDTVLRLVGDIDKDRDRKIVLRFRDHARRVVAEDITYTETVDHDQMVHFKNGDEFAMRCSSQALFDQLSHDPRFFKAGSSYIVNLSQVRSLEQDGLAKLADGTVIAVPVRLRKPFESALMNFGL